MANAGASVMDIRPDSSLATARTGSLATYSLGLSDSTVDLWQVEQELHCFTSVDVDRHHFVSRLQGQSKLISFIQGSRLAVTDISIWILYSGSRSVFRVFTCFGDLLAGSMDEEGVGSVVAAPFAVTLVTSMWIAVNFRRQMRWKRNEFEEGTSVPTCGPALICGIVMWHPY